MSEAPRGFAGNKRALPRRLCAVCGREMVWRRAWAKNWAAVKYCSEGCRKRRRSAAGAPSGPDGRGGHGG
ncbi:MAG: DUF2256 domain-containing protein [Sandarakinorhabdus sp.]|nr:DUF2256 domain-containing protein [Sandarakinorhabdus sp.]